MLAAGKFIESYKLEMNPSEEVCIERKEHEKNNLDQNDRCSLCRSLCSGPERLRQQHCCNDGCCHCR